MNRLGAVLVPMILMALACGVLVTPETALPTTPETAVEPPTSEAQTVEQSTTPPNTEATITARVQATVRALIAATPIPSPTPTQSVSTFDPTPAPARPFSRTGGFSILPAPTATPIPAPTPTPIPPPSPTPARLAACEAADDSVVVSAWINDVVAASTLTQSGRYELLVAQTSGETFGGRTISFTVGNSDADQTVIWVQGGATELNLTAPGDGLSRLRPGDIDPTYPAGGPLLQPLLPHVILGTVSVGDC